MAYTVDCETIVFKIIDVLGDAMSAKLDAIDTAKDDGLTLSDIVRYYFGDKVSIPPQQNMPAIIVKAREFNPIPTGNYNRYRDNIEVEIECYISSDANLTYTKDSRTYDFDEVMEILIMRYSRAIVEILSANIQLSDYLTNMKFDGVLLSNVIPYEGVMVKACRVTITGTGATNTLG